EKVAKYTFVITGLMSSYYSVSVQGGGLFDIILSFAITGVIWGGIAYAIASFFKKEKWIFNVTSTSNEFSIKMDKLDGERISRIFENHIPIIHDQKNELKNLEFKTETHEKKQSSLTPEKYNELVRLKSLLDQQIISEDEFKSLKDNLLTK
ncbi:MAG: hypothetical protein Q8O89_04915, partial [Nanoarchaeota archaeon]|nr:hypothetical protein [Nanoarchaeota archaeon]